MTTAQQAQSFSQMLSRPVAVGDVLSEDPGISDHELTLIATESDGRQRCPRVELDDENDLASRLACLANQEHLRDLRGPLIELGSRYLSHEETYNSVKRSISVVLDERVHELMFPQPQEHHDG